MIRIPDVDLRQPSSVQTVAETLAEHGEDAMLVAGGTDLYPKMKRRQFTPDVLVSLAEVDNLEGIRSDGSELVIGSRTPLKTAAEDARIRREYPAVAEAADAVSTPTLRRMGSIGGNLCQDTRCSYYDQSLAWRESIGWCMKAPDSEGYSPDGAMNSTGDVNAPCRVAPGSPRCWAVFASDTAPALIVHDATVRLVGAEGDRTVPLQEFYRDDGIDHLRKTNDEILTEIRVPATDDRESTYRKLARRETFDFPSLGVAVAVRQAGDAVIEAAEIAVSGIGSAPVVPESASAQLEGTMPTNEVLESVGEAVADEIRPLDNTDFHPSHRNQMAAVYTKRALRSVTANAA